MFALDLFNTRYERQLQEGGVDNLEARRIDDLNMKMQDLLARAKEPAYKKNPGALAGLKRELEKIKAERDSYYKVREAGIPGNLPADQIPGKEDLLKGKGRTYYEGAEDYAGIYSPEAIALGKRFCEHYNITDDTDVQFAVEIIDSYLDQFKAAGEPVDLKRIKSGVADAFRQAYRGMGPGPNFRKKFQEAEQSPRALGAANFQRLVKANMGNIPTVNFEFIRSEENFKLDQKGLDLISDYYDGLADDQAKNYFIYRVLPSGDETLKVLKQLGWTPARPVQQELPGIPTQGELPLQEKKKSDDDLEAGDVKVARELQKLRARYPAVRSDIEAVASAEIDSTERSQQQLAAIRGANEKQDTLLKQLVALDKEQGREIDGLDQENNSLEQRLAQVQATNDRLQQAIGQITGTKKAAAKTKTTAPQGSRDIAQGGIIDVGTPMTSTPSTTSATNTDPTTSPAIASIAQQIQGLSKAAPPIRPAPGVKAANEPIQQRPKVAGSDITEHGGGIGPKQHWQDLMPEQSNPEDDDWYDDEEDQATALRSGDYVRDTMDGESGEVFRMQGDPYERRVRILDRDGKGWYIEPGRLVVVDRNDPDIQRYFGKQRQRDMDESGVAESAKPGEYYIHTVYFKDGTKKRVRVTSDEFDVADYYTKRGQSVDHVDYDFQLHSDMTEAEKEPTTRQELLNRVDKIQRMMSQERNPANLQILRKELEMIKQRYQHLKEDNDSEAVERAILNRIMVAHTDLLMKYGPDKVMQAAEEVSYNVGDVDEIGTSDVSAYVNQVKQILGAVSETQVNEKWSAKYKKSINCADPKGFSQKAHCAGRKK